MRNGVWHAKIVQYRGLTKLTDSYKIPSDTNIFSTTGILTPGFRKENIDLSEIKRKSNDERLTVENSLTQSQLDNARLTIRRNNFVIVFVRETGLK